jgi:hypothetical protein
VKVAASSRLARKREKRTLAPVQLPFLGLSMTFVMSSSILLEMNDFALVRDE